MTTSSPEFVTEFLACRVASWGKYICSEDPLRQIWLDLKKGKTHHPECFCASCLYTFLKRKNPRSRIDKENFFLYWLSVVLSGEKTRTSRTGFFSTNKERRYPWELIIPLFYEATGATKWKKFENSDREHYRIVSRYDKKFNISGLIYEKDGGCYLAPLKTAFFLREANKLLNIIRESEEYGDPLPAQLLSPSQLWGLYDVLHLATDIFEFIRKNEKEELKLRDVYRKFHLNKSLAEILLDYLQKWQVVLYDKANKSIILHKMWKINAEYYWEYLYRMHKGLGELRPFTLMDGLMGYPTLSNLLRNPTGPPTDQAPDLKGQLAPE